MWQSLTFSVLNASYETERACRLPDYLGSTLRGVLGLELQAASCFEHVVPCSACQRPDKCAYGALFEATAANKTDANHNGSGDCGSLAETNGSDHPRPYVIAAPPRRRGNYSAGERICLGVTLVGRSQAWARWVLAGMTGLAHRGIGVERQKLKLCRLYASAEDGGETELPLAGFGVGIPIPVVHAPALVARQPPPRSEALISFLTPADLKRHGKRIEHLDGPTFFRRLIRRIGTLAETYCDRPTDAAPSDFSALAALAAKVTVADQNVLKQVWDRYSNRNRGKHPLSGLAGQALFQNIAEPLWPYLILGQWLHVGKGASFGQGRYAVLEEAELGAAEPRPARATLVNRMRKCQECVSAGPAAGAVSGTAAKKVR